MKRVAKRVVISLLQSIHLAFCLCIHTLTGRSRFCNRYPGPARRYTNPAVINSAEQSEMGCISSRPQACFQTDGSEGDSKIPVQANAFRRPQLCRSAVSSLYFARGLKMVVVVHKVGLSEPTEDTAADSASTWSSQPCRGRTIAVFILDHA